MLQKLSLFLFSFCVVASVMAAEPLSSDSIAYNRDIDDVVVTGTRGAADIRHLPMTISVVGEQKLNEHQRLNVLPTLMEQVPGLMVTSRGVMGYGVSTGGSGGMMLRGISSGAGQMMVLVDGHPQYQGIYGHSISDSYQTMMTERVEVLRGPASLLYGSNAMGGVDYQLAPTFKLWLKGDNLLAQQYEINAGYPMPKATFMAGFSLDF